MIERERVVAALASVIDPELDEPITTLRFVSSVTITSQGDVEVRLRLPTPQCAPNFAFLMAADARRALLELADVGRVRVLLEDHYTGAEINAALERGEGFSGAFPGETDDGELQSLRELFMRKALLARQAHVAQALLGEGAGERALATLRVRDLPDSAQARRCLELRARLGLPCAPSAPAFVRPDGEAVPVDQFERWLRTGRLVATSLEANGGMCRSLLAFRHNQTPDREEVML